jgi:hypothetical protein
MTSDRPERAAEGDPDRLLYLGGGPLAAVLLGMALVPLRGVTVASNFTFVFVVLTIVVAELGGRRAALATAVASTLSLDFFLTEPYLKLTIASKHDVIAFCGLAVCGAVAAALSSERGRDRGALQDSRSHLELLHASIRQIEDAGAEPNPLEPLLGGVRRTLGLAAAAVRDGKGRLLASSGDASARTSPREVLRAEELLVVLPAPQRVLPAEGRRITLRVGMRTVGSLDVWGEGVPMTAEGRRVLSDVATVLAVRLGREPAAPYSPEPRPTSA